MPSEYLPVVSISRRTDMVRWYPEDMVRLLAARYPPARVHSLVVVTKFPDAVLEDPARQALSAYDQVVVQVTITGLGGTSLEPGVPPPAATIPALPCLVDFARSPERVIVRVDPIVHWKESGSESGAPQAVSTNLEFFAPVARAAAGAGVRTVKTSLVTPYPKVRRRFAARGLDLVCLSGAEREGVLRRLETEAREAGVELHYCCENTRPRGACIDPVLLAKLHPRGLPARPERAAGQRPHCGCGHSVDLAWYSAHPCASGCLYCYANPSLPAAGPEPRDAPRG